MELSVTGGDGAAAVPAPTLELEGISKHFGAVEALSRVDFEVYPAEVVALVGDNGAGKSTLVKGIAGTPPPDGGVIRFVGAEVKIHSPRRATLRRIETVYQDLGALEANDA